MITQAQLDHLKDEAAHLLDAEAFLTLSALVQQWTCRRIDQFVEFDVYVEDADQPALRTLGHPYRDRSDEQGITLCRHRPLGRGYVCTRSPQHEGPHVALNNRGDLCAAWPLTSPTVPMTV